MSEESTEHELDRPLECSECRKPISVHYTEIVGEQITDTGMCADCPQLHRRLKGAPAIEGASLRETAEAGLVCGGCGTTLDSVKVGRSVGCPQCYEVFDDVLFQEMVRSKRIPRKAAKRKKNSPLHIGRSPGEEQELSPLLKLIVLNEALEDTLKKEDYEQAALLRDQIRELTDKSEVNDEKKG